MQAGTKERYDAFARAYVANGRNGALAARIAGYEPSCAKQTARRLLTIDYLKDKIVILSAKMAEKYEETAEKWINRVKNTEDRAKLKSDFAAEARQQDIIGKHFGYFKEDNLQKAEPRAELTDEERQVLAKAGNIISLEQAKKAHRAG